MRNLRFLLPLLLFLAGASLAEAQGVTRGSSSANISVGDLNIDLTLQETDDDSINAGQQADTVIAETYAFDGSVWKRLRFGTAGSPSAQVFSVQGVPGMTPLDVTLPSADSQALADIVVATEATESAVESIDAKLPALQDGKIPVAVEGLELNGELSVGAQPASDPHFVRCSDGSVAAPCQVTGTVTVQDGGGSLTVDGTVGISGTVTVTATNLDVQSGGADLATATQAAAIQAAVEALDNAVVTATLGDNHTNTQDVLATMGLNYVYDGSNWDRWNGTVSLSAADNAVLNSIDAKLPALDGDGRIPVSVGNELVAVLEDENGDPVPPADGGIGEVTENTIRTVEASDLAHNVASAATTNSTNVKNSAGVLRTVILINTTNTVYFLRFYDSASAPTCSSSTGFKFTIPIPPDNSGFAVPLNVGFANGIGYCITGGAAGNDNTAAAVGIYGAITYK